MSGLLTMAINSHRTGLAHARGKLAAEADGVQGTA
jgi:hypothetical protein